MHLLLEPTIVYKKTRAEGLVIDGPEPIRDFLIGEMKDEALECMWAVFLNSSNEIMAKKMFSGEINQCPVFPRSIARMALLCEATSVIIAHNHPSGSVEPSQADKNITAKIRNGLKFLEIDLIDHIIISPFGLYYSFQANNLI